MSDDDAPARTFAVVTLGCPKNAVDSDKLTGALRADGLAQSADPRRADLIVVNTCAFVQPAREESVEMILDLAEQRRPGAELVVTGCLAERSGAELAEALPEVDRVVGFGGDLQGRSAGVPVRLGTRRESRPALDLLELPRSAPDLPWAYVKVAEGCDRRCGFCAIPSFRGPQRSRSLEAVLAEIDGLAGAGVREVVLVAQDLASVGRDQGRGERIIEPLVARAAERVDRVRLLYLYPSELHDGLIDVIIDTGVPYFDLSLQHVSRPLLRRMRRWGHGEAFLERIAAIRRRCPDAVFRSNFIVGYPGESEEDHDELLGFVEAAQLDWCGFFEFSPEEGTHAATLDRHVDPALARLRLAELTEAADRISAERRDALVGSIQTVLVDRPGQGRSHREAPEIDGVVRVPSSLEVGSLADVRIVAAEGPDLVAEALADGGSR